VLLDAHTHVVPDELPFGCPDDDRYPRFRLAEAGGGGEVVVRGEVFRRVTSAAWDPDVRLRAMDESGVHGHVVSPMPELLAYWAPVETAGTFARGLNDWIARFVGHAPERLYGLGSLPLQHPELAVEMARELVDAGLRGVLVGSHVNGTSIADDSFVPVWEALGRLGLSVFVHAFHPAHTELFPPRIANAVTFPWEIGFATSALIGRAIPARVPALRFLMSHGGGGALPTLPRLIDAWDSDAAVRAHLGVHPLELARSLWYDSAVFDPRVLELGVELVGADRFVLGSDYPFMQTPCDGVLCASSLAGHTGISSTNARRWLGLSV